MKLKIYIIAIFFIQSITGFSQETQDHKVVITGVRFSYPLVEKWIAGYKAENPQANIVIESRGTTDPSKYDLLIEAYEPDAAIKEDREYLYIARYALLPVANSKSAFAKQFSEKGLTEDLIKQIYFNNIYAEKKEAKKIDAEYTVYTRLQKAGAPITFSHYFGFEQANIKGKAIAGADEHLVKALLKDSTAVSYNVPSLLYDLKTRTQVNGLTILPVDADGNGRITNDERFYDNLDNLILKLEEGQIKNIPIEYIHLSVGKLKASSEVIQFLRWVLYNGQDALHESGYLKPETKRFEKEKEKFEQLARNKKNSN